MEPGPLFANVFKVFKFPAQPVKNGPNIRQQ